jgi:hypothetical protein
MAVAGSLRLARFHYSNHTLTYLNLTELNVYEP